MRVSQRQLGFLVFVVSVHMSGCSRVYSGAVADVIVAWYKSANPKTKSLAEQGNISALDGTQYLFEVVQYTLHSRHTSFHTGSHIFYITNSTGLKMQ